MTCFYLQKNISLFAILIFSNNNHVLVSLFKRSIQRQTAKKEQNQVNSIKETHRENTVQKKNFVCFLSQERK